MVGCYGSIYGFRIGFYIDKYVELKEEIENFFFLIDYRYKLGYYI